MKSVMERLVTGRHQKSTKKTYQKTWRSFNKFIIKLDEFPKTWEERISLYVTHLITNNAKSATIKSYISAIKAVLADDGYELKQSNLLFNALTRTCRLEND